MQPPRRIAVALARACAVAGAATLVALPLRSSLDTVSLAMLYLVALVLFAARSSPLASALASVITVAAFDFFCVPPYGTLAVESWQYAISLTAMLLVALIVSSQTARIRTQADAALEREARTDALYRLSERLAGETRVFELASSAAALAEEVFSSSVLIFLPENESEGSGISFRRRTADVLPLASTEQAIANLAFTQGVPTGRGTNQSGDAAALYVPLRGARRTVGVLAILADLHPDQRHLLDLFARQTAQAIERALSHSAAETARAQAQLEETRSSLLSAVSHDLRTPLASITGAASTLRSQGDKLDEAVRTELLDSIYDEAERLSRLVRNLLDMTRFSSGQVTLRRDAYPLEEIIGSALARLDRQLAAHPVTTHLPGDLPFVIADDVLLGQVFVNLLENAAKYTPPGTPLEIEAWTEDGRIIVEVRDRGPGFAPGEEDRLFDKFYRGPAHKAARGAGLGLAICRAITEAHGGRITAANRGDGGAVFRLTLPCQEPSPEVVPS